MEGYVKVLRRTSVMNSGELGYSQYFKCAWTPVRSALSGGGVNGTHHHRNNHNKFESSVRDCVADRTEWNDGALFFIMQVE